MILLDGKRLAEKIRKKLAQQVSVMDRKPVLAMVLVGDNQASRIYIRNKTKACNEVGIITKEIVLSEDTSEDELISNINDLNLDGSVTAIMLQLPLPKHMDRYAVLARIKPEKDADCLNPLNFGSFFQKGEADFPIGPATPVGIVRLFEEHKVKLEGKCAVLLGYSDIVGKPLSEMLLSRGATVTICHQKTQDLKSFTQKADILVSATGVKHLVTEDMVKKGAAVVDVGINRDGKKITGDVDFERVSRKASFISPVPGGVGPMTVAILLENVVRLAELRLAREARNAPAAPRIGKTAREIRDEFGYLLKRMEGQYSMLDDLKNRIAVAESKQEMAVKAKAETIELAEEMLNNIAALKPSGWLTTEEDYVNEIKKLILSARSKIIQKLRNLFASNSQGIMEKIEPSKRLPQFEIPAKCDEYYDVCKNFVENDIEENEKDIDRLERKDRELETKIAKIEDEIRKFLKMLDEWDDWLGGWLQDSEESAHELEMAVAQHVELEKMRLQQEIM